mmetsp:Transcript_43284/g.80418  ORF Transcript_43284/g.80418 Transcript_43284/m.80418 type:complete len:219 (-) Transcript_43284:588-1244(-)
MDSSSLENFEGVWNEFITSFVSFPVKQAKPIAHSVFRRIAPLSRMFSAPRAMVGLGLFISNGGRVNLPEYVLTDALGGSDVRAAMYPPCPPPPPAPLFPTIVARRFASFATLCKSDDALCFMDILGVPPLSKSSSVFGLTGFRSALSPSGLANAEIRTMRFTACSSVSSLATCAGSVLSVPPSMDPGIIDSRSSRVSGMCGLVRSFKFVSPSMELVSM